MNRLHTVCLLVLAAGFALVPRAEILPGDTRDRVVAELGQPNGTFTRGDREVLLYPHGTVEFRDGKALKIALSDPAEVAAREAAKAEAKRAAEEARQASIREGGEKIRDLLGNENFKNQPPAERIRALDRIASLHPGTPMPPEYDEARRELAGKNADEEARKAMDEKKKRLEDLKDSQSKLSSAKRRRFNRTNGDEMKALEKELEKP